MVITDQSLDDRVRRLFLETDPDLVADPWPLYAELQEMDAVLESGPLFLVTRFAEVKALFWDTKRFSSDSRRHGTRAKAMRASLSEAQLAAWDEIAALHSGWMVTNDDPVHGRLRDVAHRAFAPKRIAELERSAQTFVDEAIERISAQETADLMDIALEMPLYIITDMLGVPARDRALIKEYSRQWFEYQFVPDDRLFISLEAQHGLEAYVHEMIEENRRRPDPTSLVQAFMGAEHVERLTEAEMAANFFLFLFAGHETTTNLIATGMMELLLRPEQWRKVVRDPSLVPNAVEEMIRYVSPGQFHNRVAREDLELSGKTVPAGSTVTMLTGGANRDPRVFRDAQAFDIERDDARKHIAFGYGPHTCLGTSLARLEGTIALRTLARRLPDLRLATDTFTWRGGAQLRGLKDLPVHPGRLAA
jgi:cytochrome P450